MAANLNFSSDQEILKYCFAQMQSSSDFASLTCAELESVQPSVKLESEYNLHGAEPSFLLQSLEWFCCSFVLDTCIQDKPSSEQMKVDEEVSAFEEEVEAPNQT